MLVRKGLGHEQLKRLSAASECPMTIADLATGAATTEDARSWAQELGLGKRVESGRFVQAWLEAMRPLQQRLQTASTTCSDGECTAASPNNQLACQAQEETGDRPLCNLPTSSSEGELELCLQLFSSQGNSQASSSSSSSDVTKTAALDDGKCKPKASTRRQLKFRHPLENVPTSVLHPGAMAKPCGKIHSARGKAADACLASDGRLQQALESCDLFSGFVEKGAWRGLKSKLKAIEAKATGDVVFRAGQQADEMYFVSAGDIEIRSSDGAFLSLVSAGGYFGEIGVLFAGFRTADAIVAKGPCQLHVLCRSDLVAASANACLTDDVESRGQALQQVRSWFVGRLPLFAQCASEPGFLAAIASALQVRTASAGDMVVREGSEGHEMFFIFKGSVAILSRQKNLSLSAPEFFGELSLLYAEPRSASVKCTSVCRFYVLDRDSLHRIMQEFPRMIGTMYSKAQEASNLKAHFVRKIPLFKSMIHNEEFMANMQLALEGISVGPGECFVQQGAMSDGRMFIIVHGHAEVRKIMKAGEAAKIVATLQAGAIFGEIALLLDTPRVASVQACGHCHAYTLARDAFETLAVVYKSWWQELVSERGIMLKQLKQTGIAINQQTTTKTHHLEMPEMKGTSVSSMLSAAESASKASAVPKDRQCLVCLGEEKCILSMPCGHITACASCHPSLPACPICRETIEKGIRAFF